MESNLKEVISQSFRAKIQSVVIDIVTKKSEEQGYLSTQDLNQITVTGVDLIPFIQNRTGETREAIYQRIKEGKFLHDEFLSLIKDE
jgi:hypothetical protein